MPRTARAFFDPRGGKFQIEIAVDGALDKLRKSHEMT
jgi:hypothetical protein